MAMDKTAMLRLITDSGVYLVTPDGLHSEQRLRAVGQALAGGARVIQLRDKGAPRRQLLEEARAMKSLCHEWGAIFVVNDDLALAWCVDADGVHVGQDDLPPEEARRLLGPDKLIGLSVSYLQEAQAAAGSGIDYLGVGAIFATPTKTDAELAGLELLRVVRGSVELPLVAIGGIDLSNAREVFEAGADAVAVVRGVFAQPDISGAARQLLQMSQTAKAEKKRG